MVLKFGGTQPLTYFESISPQVTYQLQWEKSWVEKAGRYCLSQIIKVTAQKGAIEHHVLPEIIRWENIMSRILTKSMLWFIMKNIKKDPNKEILSQKNSHATLFKNVKV